MALRLVEVRLPAAEAAGLPELLASASLAGRVRLWELDADDGYKVVTLLVRAEESEGAMDLLARRFGSDEGFRMILLPVEAALPREEETEAARPEEETPPAEKPAARVSREELYEDVAGAAEVSPLFVVLVVLSSVVAAIGLLRGDTAVVIGAMVIAPLLGPNVALSLATTLGDPGLAARALKASLVGIATALALSVTVGAVFEVSPDVPAIAARTRVGAGDIVLALAAGAAGALSVTTGAATALVGVMVAVALLPPLVVCGMLAGAGRVDLAAGAALLTVANVICVNLAGVLTFLSRGIAPMNWWEAERARRATRLAVALWVGLLLVLLVLLRG